MWSNTDVEMGGEIPPPTSAVPPPPPSFSWNEILQNPDILTDPDSAHRILAPSQRFTRVPTVVKRPYDPGHHTRIGCISDTHGRHRRVSVPRCDILLHGGDFTMSGEHRLVADMGGYFGEILRGEDTAPRGTRSDGAAPPEAAPSRNGAVGEIVCIAGNHDITLEPDTYAANYRLFHPRGPLDTTVTKSLLTHCTYLQDESYLSNGIHFYGSPWSPEFGSGWAFNQPRTDIHTKWDAIPTDTDVLLTHGPPLGRGDYCLTGVRAGCVDLLHQIQTRIRPRIHLFGHIHEGYGVTCDGRTLFVNASSCTIGYSADNPCVVIDLPHDRSLPAVVVKPCCSCDGAEVVAVLREMCVYRVAYRGLVPFFEGATPLLEGRDLVRDDFVAGDIGCRLEMHREKHWFVLKRALQDFVMELRTRSY